MAGKKKEKSKEKSKKESKKIVSANGQNSLDKLGRFQMTSENKVNLGAVAENNTTQAEKENMNRNLIGVARQVTNLLENMGAQLKKEDTQREKLISFFEVFTCVITLGPVIAVIIVYCISQGKVGIGTQLAALVAFINIPVSSIGVLKCIAESLFNDTYRKTMPGMITKITNALANYDVVYSGHEQSKSRKKGQEKE